MHNNQLRSYSNKCPSVDQSQTKDEWMVQSDGQKSLKTSDIRKVPVMFVVHLNAFLQKIQLLLVIGFTQFVLFRTNNHICLVLLELELI